MATHTPLRLGTTGKPQRFQSGDTVDPIFLLSLPHVSNGRLSLSNTIALIPQSTNITNATSVWFHRFNGPYVALYTNSVWEYFIIPSSPVSISLPSTTNTTYDVFGYNNSGTLTLELVSTSRTDMTGLVDQDGVWVKSGSTNKRWFGMVRTGGTTGQSIISTSQCLLYNAYNQAVRVLYARDTTGNWTYATADTWRAKNGGSTLGVASFGFLVGRNTEIISISTKGAAYCGSQQLASTGVGINSTTANSSELWGAYIQTPTTAAFVSSAVDSKYNNAPGAGYILATELERIANAATTFFYGTESSVDANIMQNGMTGNIPY